jgi:hypothetical protein
MVEFRSVSICSQHNPQVFLNESTGSPVITDGEQRKYHNFATYCVEGLPNTAPDGFKLPFADGHARRWPRLTSGPFCFLLSFHPSIRESNILKKYATASWRQRDIFQSNNLAPRMTAVLTIL